MRILYAVLQVHVHRRGLRTTAAVSVSSSARCFATRSATFSRPCAATAAGWTAAIALVGGDTLICIESRERQLTSRTVTSTTGSSASVGIESTIPTTLGENVNFWRLVTVGCRREDCTPRVSCYHLAQFDMRFKQPSSLRRSKTDSSDRLANSSLCAASPGRRLQRARTLRPPRLAASPYQPPKSKSSWAGSLYARTATDAL